MAEELGKIEKPSVSEFKEGRKLFFVPLIFLPAESDAELREICSRYWRQVEEHLQALEEKLSRAGKIYHELIADSSEKGIAAIKEVSSGSYQIVKRSLDRGTKFEAIEDKEILAEFMDWSRCLAVGLESKMALKQVYEAYLAVQRKRNERLVSQIDQTLDKNEPGILLMREGHQLQFQKDIQIFYVAPPTLDEIRRWQRDKQENSQPSGAEKSTHSD